MLSLSLSISLSVCLSVCLCSKVVTLSPNFWSPQLGNTRDIAVYLPPSLMENHLQRSVDVLVLLDGTDMALTVMAQRNAFDAAVMEGTNPETVIIGVPAATNGTVCPTGICT